MTITLELPPEAEANLVAQAKASGLSLEAFLRSIITTQAAVLEQVKTVQAFPREGEALDRAIDEVFDSVPLPPGVGEGAMAVRTGMASRYVDRFQTLLRLLPETPEIFPTWRKLVLQDRVSGIQVHHARRK